MGYEGVETLGRVGVERKGPIGEGRTAERMDGEAAARKILKWFIQPNALLLLNVDINR